MDQPMPLDSFPSLMVSNLLDKATILSAVRLVSLQVRASPCACMAHVCRCLPCCSAAHSPIAVMSHISYITGHTSPPLYVSDVTASAWHGMHHH